MLSQAAAKFFFFLLGVLIGIAVLAGGWYWYVYIFSAQPTYPTAGGLNDTLLSQNTAYSQAESQLTQGNVKGALQNFNEALGSASDPTQEAQIKYKIAHTDAKSASTYMDAIPLYKDIASNQQYPSIARAYSVMYLAELYTSYFDPNIVTATFSNAPYNLMYVPGDIALSYRHVYEYAVSIYPLGLAEARIADWYANDLKTLMSASSPDQAAIQKDTTQIQNALTAANADVARIQADSASPENYDASLALARIAVVEGKLALLGKGSASDAETTFQKAQQLYTTLNSVPNQFTMYNYANFLTQMDGTARAQDIAHQLSGIYNGNKVDSMSSFLTSARTNTNKSDVVRLASIDPKFKTYLMTLGWTAADFN